MTELSFKMTIQRTAFAAAILIATAPMSAFAHGGAVDAAGCHHERSTGEYHCHRGDGTSADPVKATRGESTNGVATVIDGDTIEIHGTRIRLHGIDAPESAQTCLDAGEKTYRCGQLAALALSDHIGRRTVTCETKDIDRYGRLVGACEVGGQSINAWMVARGWAVAYRQYSRDYVGDEDQARVKKLGIWRGELEMPWDWRKAKKAK